MKRILNYYPNYPTYRLYFGEVETPYIGRYIIPQKVKVHLVAHTDKFILNIDSLNQIWIVNKLIQMIWYMIKDVRKVGRGQKPDGQKPHG